MFTVLACAGLAALACSGDGAGAGRDAGGGEITVFAAASLTDAFHEIGAAFRATHPGTDTRFNFGGSPTLRVQIEQGARADVFASADGQQMELAQKSGLLASPPMVFARNSLVIITPAADRGRVSGPADLACPGLKLVVTNKDVPAGAYFRQMLANMDGDPDYGAGFGGRVLSNVVSEESNVKQVVAKVELGEADAGVVYATDVTPSVAPELRTISVPAKYNVVAEYPIARVADGGNPKGGQAFIDFVLSPAGQAVLKKYGFLAGS